ncbi:hypothetical protein PPROV_000182700 [Pycnococcus provasolii]|uniref:Peptidase M20 dimerisation domain-containing protein n=1 Tax=Pycnococcus provasolii TaxID=41880 RepID=A0A830H8Z6_9CHLO|nr:hypothetical protein PPROV_000182700 [Pycnococcus provasolii]
MLNVGVFPFLAVVALVVTLWTYVAASSASARVGLRPLSSHWTPYLTDAGDATPHAIRAQTWLAEHRDASVDVLAAFVKHASVSADASKANDVKLAADALVKYLRDIGFNDAAYHELPLHGAITASCGNNKAKPTVLFYGHFDVQPAVQPPNWKTEPYTLTPSEDGTKLHGRGASDNKGAGVVPLLRAVEAMLRTHDDAPTALAKSRGASMAPPGEKLAGVTADGEQLAKLCANSALPSNVKLLLEGQEEVLSPHLGAWLAQPNISELLRSDYVVSTDGMQPSLDVPGIMLGNRGAASIELEVSTANRDVHSGMYGGTIPNALHVMSAVVASFHDAQGAVVVPGFYDDVVMPDEATRAAFNDAAARLGDADDSTDLTLALRGLPGGTFGETSFANHERRWLRPSLDVVGVWGGHTSGGVKTIIPCRATAKVTARLVEGMSARDTMRRIVAHAESMATARGARLTWRYLRPDDGAPPKDEAGEREAFVTLQGDGSRVRSAVSTMLSDAEATSSKEEIPAMGTPAFASSMDSTLSQAIAATLKRAYGGVKPIWFQTGATVPAMTLLSKNVMSGANDRVNSLGCSLPEHRVHSPDEYVRVEAFATCHLAYVDLLYDISQRSREGSRSGRDASEL